jgi:Gas vesicle synthesis protein GvpO
MAETRKAKPARKRTTKNGKPVAKRGAGGEGAATPSRQPSSSADATARRNGLSTLDAVERARERLAALLGRPVESVLGVDRDHGHWVVTAQVVELARIPNSTDVLGEYETILDRSGEVVSYRRTHRYNRGHVDGEG